MSATNALETLIGNALFLGGAFSFTQWSIALFTTAPAEDGSGGVEVSSSGTGYARVNSAANGTNWAKDASQDGQERTVYRNAVALQFSDVTADWGTVSHVGLYSQAGTLCFVAPLTTSRTIINGDLGPTILIGELAIAIG